MSKHVNDTVFYTDYPQPEWIPHMKYPFYPVRLLSYDDNKYVIVRTEDGTEFEVKLGYIKRTPCSDGKCLNQKQLCQLSGKTGPFVPRRKRKTSYSATFSKDGSEFDMRFDTKAEFDHTLQARPEYRVVYAKVTDQPERYHYRCDGGWVYEPADRIKVYRKRTRKTGSKDYFIVRTPVTQ